MLARLAAAFTTWCFLAATLQAEIKPYPLFSDNAVFQRDKPLIVWGIADPGEDITPVLEGPDVPRFDKTIFANSDGSWRITLPPLKAGGPYTLILKSRNGQVRINNFLVGEVWLCAGESNMEWPLATTQNGPKHVSEATNPTLRLLTI
ncbi:MAG TPA: hypothetical protein VKS79_01385, partial [Gemmataceae bacterium]|nr:hypothetical protein [Gemmataceae bacterium]